MGITSIRKGNKISVTDLTRMVINMMHFFLSKMMLLVSFEILQCLKKENLHSVGEVLNRDGQKF